MADETWTAVPIPETTRTGSTNKYAPLIDELLKSGKARANTEPYATDADRKAVDSKLSKMRKAANDKGKSVLKTLVDNGDGTATLTVWLVDRIVRPRDN